MNLTKFYYKAAINLKFLLKITLKKLYNTFNKTGRKFVSSL